MTGDLEILPGFHDENRRGGSGGGHQTIPSERVVACALDAHPEETKSRARVGPQPGRRIAGPTGEHQTVNPPHGLPDREFETLFTPDRPVIFAYHGYPLLIHRLTYRRMNHENLHVRGYKEEGTTTTPFDMVMLNDLDRFRLVIDVPDRVPGLEPRTARLRQEMVDARLDARRYGREHGEDPREIAQWQWDVATHSQ